MEKRITAKMVLDSSGFNDSLKGINTGLRNVKGELADASTQVGVFGRDTEKLKSVQESLGKQYELQAKKVDLYTKSIEKTKDKMQDNIKERDRLKASLDSANASYDKAVALYGKESSEAKKAKAVVSELEGEYNKKADAVESNAKAVERYEGNLGRANAQMNKTQGELNKINAELDKSNNKWLTTGKVLETVGGKMQTVGGNMTKVGNGILKVTAPLVGMGVGALKVSADFEEAMSNVQALSQATEGDFEKLKAKAREMGKETSMSATESADAMGELALAGWDIQQIMDGIHPILKLAEAGNLDLTQASKLTTESMNALGIGVNELEPYLDILAQTSRSSGTTIDELGTAYIGVGAVLRNLNVPLEESATVLGILADNGIKGSEAGTSLKAVITNLTAPTGQAKKALDELGVSAFDNEGNFIGLEAVFGKVNESMEGMTEEQRNSYLAMIGGKEHVAALSILLGSQGEEYDTLKGKISGADGALDEMATTMKDNLKGDLERLKSQLEDIGIQLGATLIPMASRFIETVGEWVQKFSELSPKTQDMIVKGGLLAVGLGTLLSVGGKVVSGAGSIIQVLGTVSGLMAGTTTATATLGTASTVAVGASGAGGLLGMGSALAGVVVAAGPYILIGAAIAAVGYAVYKGLSQRAIPELEIFDETISETTKNAVGNFLKLEKSATISLNKVAWGGQKVTASMEKDVVDNFTSMKDSVVKSLEEQKKDGTKEIQKMVDNSTHLSEEEKENMIRVAGEKYDKVIKETQDGGKRVEEIMKNAKDNNRTVTEEEMEEIITIKEKMKETGIKTYSETEAESLTIMENLKQGSGILTAEMASETVKNSLEQKEGAIANAEAEYQERLKQAALLRADGTREGALMADAIVLEAERQRADSIEKAEQMHEGVVTEAKEQAKEHVKAINWETGEIMSVWGRAVDWFKRTPIIKRITTKKSNIFEDGTPSLTNRPTRGPLENWTGNRNFEGGLTTLHERGYVKMAC